MRAEAPSMSAALYYIHDPMCSWCWAFQPVLKAIVGALPSGVGYRRVLGGLAPDTDEPMDTALRERLMETWRRIEQTVPGTHFNFEFWTRCQARRSTYPACRAVLAARAQDPALDARMTAAIQSAYYQQARNPSDEATLLALAGEIGLDPEHFAAQLNSPEVAEALEGELQLCAELGVESFPSLVLEVDGSRWPIPLDYRDPEISLEALRFLYQGA